LLETYQNKYSMSIKRVTIESDYALEGMLSEGAGNKGVLICHPHPLYGGDMYNSVVGAIVDGFASKGFTTVRFNFRGVGSSGGFYDEGDGEIRDVLAGLQFLKNKLSGEPYVVLAGYSFGAWISCKAASLVEDIDSLFLVSYPFSFYPAHELKAFKKKICFVGGTDDDIGPLDELLKVYRDMPTLDKYLKVIETSHFYGGKEQEITDFIKETDL
jgi:alpha/beta superfamily hydrolase